MQPQAKASVTMAFTTFLQALGENWPFTFRSLITLIAAFLLSSIMRRSARKKKVPSSKSKPRTQRKIHLDEFDPVKEIPAGKTAKWEFVSGKKETERTPLLGNFAGRSTWRVSGVQDAEEDNKSVFNRSINPNSGDLLYREKATEDKNVQKVIKSYLKGVTDESPAKQAASSAMAGSLFYSQLQTEDGHWPGDYGGPMFLLPGLVIACYVTGVELGQARKDAMLKYILNHQQEDGGWGTHIEGVSTMFGSTLNYTAARLLGMRKMSDAAAKGRAFLHLHGGALAAPQWAKLWLACLGCYEWEGVNPVPPELWLLPNWFPFHPGRLWCHCRMVYLPMSALFGMRYTYENVDSDALVLSLRGELYANRYDWINWGSERETICPRDVYNPQTKTMTIANWFLHHTIENPLIRTVFGLPLNYLRNRAMEFCFNMTDAEDIHTNWIDIGPVSKAMNLIVVYARHGSESKEFQKHVARVPDYLWVAEDGMKMQGYNGSQFWDSAFGAHAIGYSKIAAEKQGMYDAGKPVLEEALSKVYKFTDASQVVEDVWERDLYFRDKSKGGWPFSTRDHGWPISDCTSEGIKTVILLNKVMEDKANHNTIGLDRLEDAVSIVLGMHNDKGDGGWASYEQNRGYEWYEILNPAQVFGDIMIDYSYTECTSACLQALCKFAIKFPESKYAKAAINASLAGSKFILGQQRDDGAWYGSWAVCFTYGAWFGIDGLCSILELQADLVDNRSRLVEGVKRGISFLISKQSADGGWGESVEACATKEWVPCEDGSQVVQTAWVLLALVRAGERLQQEAPKDKLLQSISESGLKAAAFLQQRQLDTGDWAQENISGVFNKSCGITYTAYRNVFPIWALARFSSYYKN